MNLVIWTILLVLNVSCRDILAFPVITGIASNMDAWIPLDNIDEITIEDVINKYRI